MSNYIQFYSLLIIEQHLSSIYCFERRLFQLILDMSVLAIIIGFLLVRGLKSNVIPTQVTNTESNQTNSNNDKLIFAQVVSELFSSNDLSFHCPRKKPALFCSFQQIYRHGERSTVGSKELTNVSTIKMLEKCKVSQSYQVFFVVVSRKERGNCMNRGNIFTAGTMICLEGNIHRIKCIFCRRILIVR